MNEMCLPMQDELLLSGGVVGGSDTKERLGGPHALELGTPQVGGPLVVCSYPCGPLQPQAIWLSGSGRATRGIVRMMLRQIFPSPQAPDGLGVGVHPPPRVCNVVGLMRHGLHNVLRNGVRRWPCGGSIPAPAASGCQPRRAARRVDLVGKT